MRLYNLDFPEEDFQNADRLVRAAILARVGFSTGTVSGRSPQTLGTYLPSIATVSKRA